MKNNILVIGSINMDMILKINEVPQKGETIFAQSFSTSPGGKGANQAYAIAKLGGSVGFLGAVGADMYGKSVIANLQTVGVDTSGVAVVPEIQTGTACIMIDKDGDNRIIISSGANQYVTPALIESQREKIEQCDVVVLQQEIPFDAVCYAIELAHELGKQIILNPAPILPELFQNKEILSKVDILIPNEIELSGLTGEKINTASEIAEATRKLVFNGVGGIFVTLGEKGSIYSDRERFRYFDPLAVEAVDTTAAGDTYIGAVALYLAQGKSIEEAGLFATKASALTVTKLGAQHSIPTMEEVCAFGNGIR